MPNPRHGWQPRSKDEKKDERMYGESFKPGSHRDSSRRRTRHLRRRRKQEGEEDVGGWRTPAPWRTFLERFETRATIVGREKPAKETSVRSKRVVRTKLRPSGKWNAGNWKSLNAPVCEDAYGNRRCSPSLLAKPLFRFSLPPPPRLPPSTTNFASALSWFWIASIYNIPNCEIKYLEFIIISKNWTPHAAGTTKRQHIDRHDETGMIFGDLWIRYCVVASKFKLNEKLHSYFRQFTLPSIYIPAPTLSDSIFVIVRKLNFRYCNVHDINNVLMSVA